MESTELAQRQYEAGRVDFQRLIESQRALARLQDQVALTRGQAALELVAVYKALGGGWQGSVIGHPVDDPQPIAPPFPEILSEEELESRSDSGDEDGDEVR